MKERILTNWRSTLLGLIVIAYELYKIFVLKQAPDWFSAVSILVSIGFIGYKGKSKTPEAE